MLSRDLKRLSDTFNAWSSGEDASFPSVADWLAFQSDLKTCHAKALLLELGCPVDTLDVVAEVAKPGTNIMLFPTPAQRSQQSEVRRD